MEAAIEAAHTEDIPTLVQMINDYNLPREVLPTSALTDPRVWEAMLPSMGMTAVFRNLRNMIKIGYISQGSDALRDVIAKISDEEALRRGRIHPAQVFLALKGINPHFGRDQSRSSGIRYGKPDDTQFVAPQALERALEDVFYKTFENVEPTGKNILVALDVSASMDQPVSTGLGTAMEWSALMAMVTVRSELYADTFAFSQGFTELPIRANDSLSAVIRKISGLPFQGTDCGLPMKWARENKRDYDAFLVYTDSETWAGKRSPMQELRDYRKNSRNKSRKKSHSHEAKLGVIAMVSSSFSIADPNDKHTMDVVGMDTTVPAVLSDFIRS